MEASLGTEVCVMKPLSIGDNQSSMPPGNSEIQSTTRLLVGQGGGKEAAPHAPLDGGRLQGHQPAGNSSLCACQVHAHGQEKKNPKAERHRVHSEQKLPSACRINAGATG